MTKIDIIAVYLMKIMEFCYQLAAVGEKVKGEESIHKLHDTLKHDMVDMCPSCVPRVRHVWDEKDHVEMQDS